MLVLPDIVAGSGYNVTLRPRVRQGGVILCLSQIRSVLSYTRQDQPALDQTNRIGYRGSNRNGPVPAQPTRNVTIGNGPNTTPGFQQVYTGVPSGTKKQFYGNKPRSNVYKTSVLTPPRTNLMNSSVNQPITIFIPFADVAKYTAIDTMLARFVIKTQLLEMLSAVLVP